MYGLEWRKRLVSEIQRGCLRQAVEATDGVEVTTAYAEPPMSWVEYTEGGSRTAHLVLYEPAGDPASLSNGVRINHQELWNDNPAPQQDIDALLPAMRRVNESVLRFCGVDLTSDVEILCRGVRCDAPANAAVN
jgi:hypothetical protein